ncbi:AMP-binding protein [Halomonas sp. A11-A]|uniref:AMP-binding protein n=1 Tax=Halomonas sp. A11-A TaxID=2183985 RepID=UPI000D70DC6A|nr:AMP-binding protein [Halomonas sp. A11-A]PWV75354.1 long-subunit acyl-CoA synthetase (AMP-forming) [Halomonas sp. A11-A]
MRTSPEAFLARLARHAEERPTTIALDDGARHVIFAELPGEIEARRQRLAAAGATRVALALDNGIDWALWDLALLRDGRVAVPVPGFFSQAQRCHLVASAGLDAWIGHGGEAHGFAATRDPAIATRRVTSPPALHAGTTRITFTSGTSGTPKGVCLDGLAPLTVAESLAEAVAGLAIERHLAMLPLSTLLENIGGLYAPLWLGASVHLPGVAALGWRGASGFDPRRALATLDACRPHSLILVPQLLQALVEARPKAPESLRFVAVGGARVAGTLLGRARRGGWPVFEGYGLSECASVVCLNRPGEPARGVGRPLPHAEVRLDASGEVWVRGATMLGYLGESAPTTPWHATGDLGRWEGDALVLEGRRREVFITAYGRNVDPQWVEGELCARPTIAQALVHGEALPANRALLVPASAEVDDAALAAAVAEANAGLPDYARVHEWRRSAPFTPENRQLTANGRLRRDAILAAHGDWLRTTSSCPRLEPSSTLKKECPMTPYQQLQQATRDERDWLLATPLLTRALEGRVSRDEYLAFLGQAYHHVRFTVPLMMACGARLPDRLGWLREALVEYIEEEHGHERWILDDIRAAGGDAEAAAARPADPATRLMVATVRDTIEHGNPVGFFGMVQVLEGTSTALATQAAEKLQASLALPDEAVRYLTSHGSLDIGHLAFFEGLVNRLEADDLAAVVDTARLVYRLYGAMFRGVEARCAGGSAARELCDALA